MYGQAIVCIYSTIFSVVSQFPQGIVLAAHLISIAAGHIGGEQDTAEQRVDPGQGLLLLCGQLAVFLTQEKDIGIAAVGAPVELAAENRVADGLLCRDSLAVEKPHIPYIIPVQPYITPNAAVVNDTKGRHDRHAAAAGAALEPLGGNCAVLP